MKIEKLTKHAFSRFGDVVEMEDAQHYTINQGFAERFNDLAKIDVAIDGGAVNLAIFTAQPRPKPIVIHLMERHPLGTQLFYPLQDEDWLVLVCDDPLHVETFHLFRATGKQGVNYGRSIWHHPLLVHAKSRFLIVDRKGPGNNLEEMTLPFNLQI
ncbi:MAG: ureidoglycolate lyase [Alphaproteobacteria bacterium]|nr:ureidoglycolate lyase [Alphaproteobacteria bacterium]